jgi:restriction endonuclease S subunit
MMNEFKLSDGIDEDKIFLLNLSKLTTQWSPTFYHKERLNYLNIFSSQNYKFDIKRLSQIINISSKKTVAYNVDKYIGMANIESNTGKYISSESDKGKGECSVFKKGDVLFGKLRPYLNKVYLAEFNGGCTTEFIIMKTSNESIISNKFLSIFLLLDCVVNQTKYMMTGNTLPRLQTFDIENLIIPIPPKNIQQDVINIMDNAYIQKQQKEKQAKDLLDSIDIYLLNELGITLPKIDNSLEKRIFEVNLSDIIGGRFDCKYYSLKYINILKAVNNSKYKIVELKDISMYIFQGIGQNLTKISNNIFLKVKNILNNNEIDFSNTELITEIPTNKILKDNDIITPFIGEAIKKYKFSVFIKKSNKLNYCVDNNTGVIRLKEQVNAIYISTFLMSSAGKELVNQLIGGGGVPFLGANNAKSLKIPLPPIEKQNEIAKHIQAIRDTAKQLKTEAVQDLENAKLEVEKMILGQ